MARIVNDVSDYVNLNSTAKIDDLPSGGVGFSACLWINRAGDPSAAFPRLLDKENSGATNGWALSTNKSTDTPALSITYVERRATTNKVRITAANVLSNGIWIFVGLVVAAGTTASGVHIYTGVPAGQVAEVGSYSTTTNGVGAYNSDAANNLAVGCIGPGGNNFWDGSLAEVRLYGNYLLSLTELQGIMNGNLSIPNPTQYCPLYGTVSPEPDLSLSASNAGISNATVGTHAPTQLPYVIH